MRILLVEDDELLGSGLQKGLKQGAHTVDWLKDGQTAEEVLMREEFDVIILDVGLPRRSGLQVLRKARSEGITTPVLLLTARDAVEDRVAGLDAGADDYLTKPFDLEELSARIRALHRRFTKRTTPLLKYKHLTLDPAAHTVTMDGEIMNVPRREFALLLKLLENQGQVLSRDQLVQSLYGWGVEIDSNTLEVHIHNIRKKLKADFIRTIRGVGYMAEKESSSKSNE